MLYLAVIFCLHQLRVDWNQELPGEQVYSQLQDSPLELAGLGASPFIGKRLI